MKYSAVLFDMDGTVLDTLGDIAAAVNHTLQKYSMPERSPEEVAAALGYAAAHLIRQCVANGTSEAQCKEILSDYRVYYDAHCDILTSPYDGVIPTLEALKSKGVKLALVSNKQDSAVKLLAEKYFPGYFDYTVGESETVRKKPAPDAVNSALDSMGVSADESIYIGDTEVDFQTAHNAGMDFAAVCWGFRQRTQLVGLGAEHIFDTAEQLSAFLLG